VRDKGEREKVGVGGEPQKVAVKVDQVTLRERETRVRERQRREMHTRVREIQRERAGREGGRERVTDRLSCVSWYTLSVYPLVSPEMSPDVSLCPLLCVSLMSLPRVSLPILLPLSHSRSLRSPASLSHIFSLSPSLRLSLTLTLSPAPLPLSPSLSLMLSQAPCLPLTLSLPLPLSLSLSLSLSPCRVVDRLLQGTCRAL